MLETVALFCIIITAITNVIALITRKNYVISQTTKKGNTTWNKKTKTRK